MNTISLVLLFALCAVAMAGYSGHGDGHGHHGGHHGHVGHQGHGGQQGHGGWGWRQYQGWANVNSHQTPYSYSYGLQEQGKGYNKYVWQGADTHHVTPVKVGGYGHGHGHGYH